MTQTLLQNSARILIVDDNETHADSLREGLERVGYQVVAVYSAKEASAQLAKIPFDAVVSDLMLKESSGMDVLKEVQQKFPGVVVILITAHATIANAVQAMREGASDYIEKPIQIEELRLRVARALETRRLIQENLELHRQIEERFGFEGILGNSPAMKKVFDTLVQVSPTDATVLLLGESGTGKELIAKAIHNNSKRKAGRFVAINCAALSESLIESELFGHEKGAFTGAIAAQEGKIEYASGGTLFLDEVGDMPLTTQVKLLRVLEQREILRVGSNKPVHVDIRLIAATNADLKERVEKGQFRQDLYFRLNVVSLLLPTLRERKQDLPLLIDHFLREFSKQHGKKIKGISAQARAALIKYSWPGNVRELRNALENMVVVAQSEFLDLQDLPIQLSQNESGSKSGAYSLEGRSLDEVEKDLIIANLALVGGNRDKAAKMLKIGERTLYRKIREYHLD